jgi:hypothetical protein
MSIIERDPWRTQYFDGVVCPPGVDIPTDDLDAFAWNPRHRWIYDKLRVAQSQGLACGRRESPPRHYPVFCKPVTNLKGMGLDIHVLRNAQDLQAFCTAGHFWMTLLRGDHVSTDLAVIDGAAVWNRHTIGRPGPEGTFDYWTVRAHYSDELTQTCHAWVHTNLAGYTGMVNIETIGGLIIEAHLRFSDQWPDLYGAGWIDAVVGLYARGQWCFDDSQRRDGFSVVLFGPHGRTFSHPSPDKIARLRAAPHVSSVQITFHAGQPCSLHAMPPGGFRLAIINTWDLATGLTLRRRIAREFDLGRRPSPCPSVWRRAPEPANNEDARSSIRRRD